MLPPPHRDFRIRVRQARALRRVTTAASQLRDERGSTWRPQRDGTTPSASTTALVDLALAREAIDAKLPLETLVTRKGTAANRSTCERLANRQVLSPINHPDNARLWLTGTGLTHLGSAEARDRMHAKRKCDASDSMKMFRSGLEGGKVQGQDPACNRSGSTKAMVPRSLRRRRRCFAQFALDGGEEPELAGIYRDRR